MEDAKPQCGGATSGKPEEYDLPLHVAGLCKSWLQIPRCSSWLTLGFKSLFWEHHVLVKIYKLSTLDQRELTVSIGAGFPVAAKKIKWLNVPPKVFFACKHFGTGVLIATAFVHVCLH